MRIALLLLLLCPISALACDATTNNNDPTSQVDGAEPTGSGAAEPEPENDAAAANGKTTALDGGSLIDGAAHPPDAASKVDAGPPCKKHITVVFAVGTGAGAVASHANGCWSVVDADGAANSTFRKCSTSSFIVQNASAANFAFDDTNPTASLSSDQTFLSQCSSGATGDGYEYMAYRGAWRLLTAPHVKAYFAELYSTDQTIDDYYALWPATLDGHAVSPMINIGPNNPATIESSALKMCNRVADNGYFGTYNGAYKLGMGPTDARALALVNALDTCTR